MKSRQWALPATLIVLVIGVLHSMTLASDAPGGASLDHLPVTEVAIETARGERHVFQTYIARLPEERSRGLMFVTELASNEGMLFDSGKTEETAMWMRNTPLSLDMLFLLDDGTVGRIERETVPYSRKLIPSGVPTRAVLEINGGIAGELGIREGDRAIHPIFEADPGANDAP